MININFFIPKEKVGEKTYDFTNEFLEQFNEYFDIQWTFDDFKKLFPTFSTRKEMEEEIEKANTFKENHSFDVYVGYKSPKALERLNFLWYSVITYKEDTFYNLEALAASQGFSLRRFLKDYDIESLEEIEGLEEIEENQDE